MGHCARHIGHAVVDDSVYGVSRIAVRCRLGCFNAAALINRHVNDYGSPFHVTHHLAGHQFWGCCSWDQDAPDYQIGFGAGFCDRVGI